MVLDSRIQLVKDYYGICNLDHWRELTPDKILSIDGVGKVTLDHIRLYLAGQGVALKNDQTPEHWAENLGHIKLGAQLHDKDEAIVCPFTVFIDSAEQHPFTFHGIRADADQQYRPIVITTEWKSLGRHPDSRGDYSIDGGVGYVHIERKSVSDYQGTLLGFKSGARERFEQELLNLSKLESPLVVVEGNLSDCLNFEDVPGRKPSKQRAKSLHRSTLAMLQDFRVPILFCGSRRAAEMTTFRWLERWWRKRQEASKEAERIVGSL